MTQMARRTFLVSSTGLGAGFLAAPSAHTIRPHRHLPRQRRTGSPWVRIHGSDDFDTDRLYYIAGAGPHDELQVVIAPQAAPECPAYAPAPTPADRVVLDDGVVRRNDRVVSEEVPCGLVAARPAPVIAVDGFPYASQFLLVGWENCP